MTSREERRVMLDYEPIFCTVENILVRQTVGHSSALLCWWTQIDTIYANRRDNFFSNIADVTKSNFALSKVYAQ